MWYRVKKYKIRPQCFGKVCGPSPARVRDIPGKEAITRENKTCFILRSATGCRRSPDRRSGFIQSASRSPGDHLEIRLDWPTDGRAGVSLLYVGALARTGAERLDFAVGAGRDFGCPGFEQPDPLVERGFVPHCL